VFGDLCVRCKGRLWCGLPKCPILESAKSLLPKLRVSSNSIFGPSPPSIFVGRMGYPNVYAGPLISEDKERIFSSTKELYGRGLDEIISLTSTLIRTSTKVNVKKIVNRMVETSQEIAMSERAVDTEIWVEKTYNFPQVDMFFHPTGPRVIPRKIDVVDNPVIPKKVDMVVEERLKASIAIKELYQSGYDVDYLQRLMSSGALGRDKKLVPTRWSITAVDDIASKYILKDVRLYESIDKIEYYYHEYMGNRFHIIFIPGIWEYEMIESWMRGSLYAGDWSIGAGDYEPYEGRRDYASSVTGAYYAARLAVAEHLQGRRRQAKVLIYREITPEYKLPLGVWVIREAVRHALYKKPTIFESIDETLKYVNQRTQMKEWYGRSKILSNLKHQRKLEDFFRK